MPSKKYRDKPERLVVAGGVSPPARKIELAGSEQQVHLVPVELIETPRNPHRQNFNDAKQHELEKSIRRLGLLQPITLAVRRDGYEVIFGDRRMQACRTVGMSVIPAIIKKARGIDIERQRLHENIVRDDVNRVDLAVALSKVKKNHRLTLADMAKELGVSVQYIGETISIVKWDIELQNALYKGEITFSAAREFAQITNREDMLYYLNAAVQSGCTPRLAKQWREEWALAQKYNQPSPKVEDMPEGGHLPEPTMIQCYLCANLDVHANMTPIWVHSHCKAQFTEVVLKLQADES